MSARLHPPLETLPRQLDAGLVKRHEATIRTAQHRYAVLDNAATVRELLKRVTRSHIDDFDWPIPGIVSRSHRLLAAALGFGTLVILPALL